MSQPAAAAPEPAGTAVYRSATGAEAPQPGAAPPLIACEDVSLTYDGRRTAVQHLGFTLDAGHILALVGPNGAGKTSTLRMLATLTRPTAGTLRVAGCDVLADPCAVRRLIGYLPDNFALYEQQTPVELLTFFARLHGVDPARVGHRVDALLEEFELGEKRRTPIGALSRGMKQRLGVAKTLVHEPRVLLLDEPASALDPGSRARLRESLLGLRRRGLAIVISSHILPDLAGLADTVAIMEGGRMIHWGPLDERAVVGHGTTAYFIEALVAEPAREVLAAMAGRVSSWSEPAPGRFEVMVDGGAELVAELVEALVAAGARVAHVAPRESALETVYRRSAAAREGGRS
jgi:ABC-2 type transport system ATP-binding protein